MRGTGQLPVRAVVIALGVPLVLAATACAGPHGAAHSAPPPHTTAAPMSTASPTAPTSAASAPVGTAVFGDSNSTGFAGTLEAGIAAGTTWVSQLPPEEFTLVGGWALDGATSTEMADAAVAMPDAALVIIMAGTNDIATGVPTQITLDEITRIADTVGATSVALCAIAPLNWSPGEAVDMNAALAGYARAQGWLFIDPWVQVRNTDGTWIPAYLTDGVHTSAEGYAIAGAQIAAQLSELLR
jgi:lysophospholipase L1-like esterase